MPGPGGGGIRAGAATSLWAIVDEPDNLAALSTASSVVSAPYLVIFTFQLTGEA
jgi:hypothetical protein